MKVELQKIQGNWNWGRALNIHTVSSTPIFDEDGEIAGWNTIRTDIGEELYRLKYWKSETNATKIQRVERISEKVNEVISKLIKKASKKLDKSFKIDYIVPVPPSQGRNFQPVEELAKKISELSSIPLDLKSLKKVKSTREIKGINDIHERQKLLEDAFDIEAKIYKKKNILVIDDLYRSGTTLKAITSVLKNKGKAKNVIVITITKTRSNR